MCAQSFSNIWCFETPWTVARWTPLFMEFSRQEYWSELLFPIPGDLPHPGMELASLPSLALAGRFFNTAATLEAWFSYYHRKLLTKMEFTFPFDPWLKAIKYIPEPFYSSCYKPNIFTKTLKFRTKVLTINLHFLFCWINICSVQVYLEIFLLILWF